MIVDYFRPYLAYAELEQRIRRFRSAIAALQELAVKSGAAVIVPFQLPYRGGSSMLKNGIDAVAALSEIQTVFVIDESGNRGAMALQKSPSGISPVSFPFHVRSVGTPHATVEWDRESAPRRPIEPRNREPESPQENEAQRVSGSATLATLVATVTATESNSGSEGRQPSAGEKPAMPSTEIPQAPASGYPLSENPNAAKPRLILKNPRNSPVPVPWTPLFLKEAGPAALSSEQQSEGLAHSVKRPEANPKPERRRGLGKSKTREGKRKRKPEPSDSWDEW